jgi:subtilase family serine protease
MRSSLRRFAGLLAGLALLAAGSAQAASLHASQAVSATGLARLGHEVLPGLSTAQNLGPVAANTKVLVAITVKQDLNALYRAEWAMYNPNSSTYRQFLTPSAYRQKYGIPAARLAAIRSFATTHGLQLVSPGRLYDYIELWGTARQVESTFDVQLDNFKDQQGQVFFANLQDPEIPSTLGIDAVLGLESFDKYRVDALSGHQRSANVVTKLASKATTTRLTAAQVNHLGSEPFRNPFTPVASSPKSTFGGSAQQGQCETAPSSTLGTICTGLLSPQALWNAYDLPTGNPRTDDYGQGQTIGIIGEGQTADVIAALREFEKTRGLPFVPVQVYHTDPGEDAPESGLDDSGRIEWEMDSQASTGMAPEVSELRMYFGSSLALTELTGAIGAWVNDPDGPLQVSASLGACEDTPATDPLYGASQRADQAFLIQAAMEGRTLFSSAGDTGTGCSVGEAVNGVTYSDVPVAQEYPGIDPNTTAVGGSVLYTSASGSRELEHAWDHTGGGPSKFLPQPPYQAEANSPWLESNKCAGVYGNGSSWDPNWPSNAPYLCRADVDVAAESGDVTIVTDHKVGDAYLPGGYSATSDPVQANGLDMVDFCPEGEVSSENAAEPDCAYDANAGSEETVQTDDGAEQGVMTNDYAEGGTSLSSPLWLGMWARVQAHNDAVNRSTLAPRPKASLGLANEVIYKLGSNATTDARDFYNIEIGANPLPAGPGWNYPSGWGSPNVTPLMDDANGVRGEAPASHVLPGKSDPPALVAPVTTGGSPAPTCKYELFEGSPNATDTVSGNDDANLAVAEANLGLTANQQDLRIVLNLQNMTETPPSGFTLLDYNVYWTNPTSDSSSNDAVDAEIDSAGRSSFQDGQEVDDTSEGEYAFVPSSSSAATGKITDGASGTVEIDVPLSELGLKVGDSLSGLQVMTSEGEGVAGAQPANSAGLFTLDNLGPGPTYTLGDPTCNNP